MGKILPPFFFPHVCVCRKVCVRFELIWKSPVGTCLLHPRVRYLMEQGGVMALQDDPPKNAFHTR
jgi:hypothetical protein